MTHRRTRCRQVNVPRRAVELKSETTAGMDRPQLNPSLPIPPAHESLRLPGPFGWTVGEAAALAVRNIQIQIAIDRVRHSEKISSAQDGVGGVGEENAKRHFERVWAMGLANKPYRSKFLVVQQSVRNHP